MPIRIRRCDRVTNTPSRRARLATWVCAAVLAGCASTVKPPEDPLLTLSRVEEGPSRQLAAMAALDQVPEDEAYIKELHRVVWRPGYTVRVREAAVKRLEVIDLDGLKRTLRQQLPRMNAWAGLTRLCEIIAEEEWTDLSPALASSWARPTNLVEDDFDRPEYKALAAMYGADAVQDVLFEMLITSNRVSDQGLRTRLWELLLRTGERDRLAALLSDATVPEDDLFLADLQAGAAELGVMPSTREEILWLRELRQPERRDFWSEAAAAVAALPPARRRSIELRDLAIVVSAARHDPALLAASEQELYDRLQARMNGRKHYSHGSNFNNFNSMRRERLHDWRGELTWGDLAAMLIAVRALEVRPVVEHLFDYAERDRADETTEYGGVIALDGQGRFEVLEFPPRVRQHDRKFMASQAMFEAGYTALFQFHYHAQRHRNQDYAGPGFGDVNYADNTRANCLVLAFVSEDAMNVDFYRHGRVLVDLGTIGPP